ncbi:asparagine synthetase B [candidate division KSB1 bacterium]|nr:asparagine synthetase B [candidate division KSB1 bacterium]
MFFSLFLVLVLFQSLLSQKILIFMDLNQTDHLKAYGVAYWVLEQGIDVEWLLNYRGGSFLLDDYPSIERQCRLRGVAFVVLDGAQVSQIYATIEENNMEVVLLEKPPKIAIYAPPNFQPWDDAVTLALTYAEIPYKTLWDEEVLRGELLEYDWLHLHHEDFTGQYGRFYASFHNAPWYIEQQILFEEEARRLGFRKVSELKKAVARKIKEYVAGGGFMFAMCSATDTIDIALAAEKADIAPEVFDGDPADPDCQQKLDYSKTLVFENFILEMNPLVYEFSDIDTTPLSGIPRRGEANDYFVLFDFAAKYDPVPTMLTQDHTSVIKGFMGQTTGFHKNRVKKSVIILGEVEGTDEVKYIHGNYGKGTFTFYGGHDPEDYRHLIGDPPTELSLHKNSPGYRLILNNVLFPAAKKKERKT